MSTLSKVLVVEDDGLLMLDLIDQLTDHGLTPIALSSGISAEPLLSSDVDALVTDIDLPGPLSGLALAHLAAARRPDLPIVVVSGGTRPPRSALPPHAVFIAKPYRVPEILQALWSQQRAKAAA